MKVKLITHTPEPEKVIATAAKLCYSASSVDDLQDSLTDEKIHSFLEMLMEIGHESPVEHVSFTFAIEGISRSCYDKDTFVLTDKGWKLFKDVDIEKDLICSLDDNNDVKYVRAVDKISYEYNGLMHRFKTTQIDLSVTPNHQMWVFDHEKRSPVTKTWKFIEAQDMRNCRYGFNKSSNGLKNDNSINEIVIPPVKRIHHLEFPGHTYVGNDVNLFLEFLGIWMTDGSLSFGTTVNGVRKTGNRISISQVKPYVRGRIRTLLTLLNIHFREKERSFDISDQALFDWLCSNFINGTDTKKTYYLKLPRWMFNMSKYNIDCLLRGIFLGDGSRHVNGKKHCDPYDEITEDEIIEYGNEVETLGFCIYSASKTFAKDLVELAMLSGRCANIRVVPPRTRIFPMNHGRVSYCKEQYVISFIPKGYHLYKNIPLKTRFVERYHDNVYCLELEKYHRLYVMRHGKACWCGNCSHQLVRHRIASYSQQSQRYVNMEQFNYIIPPAIYEDAELKSEYDEFMANVQKEYDKLVNALTMKHYHHYIDTYITNPDGTPMISENTKKELRNKAKKSANEDARYVLPNACETKIFVTMNIRSLYNFFKHRMCNRAQWEIRAVAWEMWKQCMEVSPTLFKHAGPSCINGKCPEGKMSCGLGNAIKRNREVMLKELYES